MVRAGQRIIYTSMPFDELKKELKPSKEWTSLKINDHLVSVAGIEHDKLTKETVNAWKIIRQMQKEKGQNVAEGDDAARHKFKEFKEAKKTIKGQIRLMLDIKELQDDINALRNFIDIESEISRSEDPNAKKKWRDEKKEWQKQLERSPGLKLSPPCCRKTPRLK